MDDKINLEELFLKRYDYLIEANKITQDLGFLSKSLIEKINLKLRRKIKVTFSEYMTINRPYLHFHLEFHKKETMEIYLRWINSFLSGVGRNEFGLSIDLKITYEIFIKLKDLSEMSVNALKLSFKLA
jgi:hypothetical protein